MDDWFSGKVAAITGAGGGIGRAVARQLASRGAAVVLADVDQESAARTAGELEARGAPCTAVRTDVSKAADAERMVQAALARFERLDFLVNCAGNAHAGPVAEMPLTAWQAVLDVHLKGTFLCCRAAIEPLLQSGGRIVNMSSNYGFKGRANGAHYSAAKAGIVSLTKVLATELAPHVNVNAVAPGPTDTPRWRAGLSDEAFAAKAERRLREIPLRRLGQPEDIADAVLFLLGPGSRWITGQVLHVNGGEFMP